MKIKENKTGKNKENPAPAPQQQVSQLILRLKDLTFTSNRRRNR
jgi:hypothetical protein